MGAWAGVKTTTATAAPRFSRASRSSSRIARIDIGRSFASITTRTSQPRATRASRVSTKSPFFDFIRAPASVPVRSSRSPAPRARSASIASSRSSKSPPLAADRARSAPRAAAAASIATRRSSSERNPAVISWRNWCIGELSRVGSSSSGELGGVAVEVALEHRADPADRAVALRLVEQLVDHRAQRAAVAEEALERARQPAVAVGEVGAERLLERLRGLVVDRLGLAQELLELGPDDVHVDRHAGVLEREQADPDGPLDEVRRDRRPGARRGRRRAPDPRRRAGRRGSGRLRPGRACAAGASGSSRTVSGGSGSAVMVRRCARSVTACLSRPSGVARARRSARAQLPRYVVSEKPLISSGTW